MQTRLSDESLAGIKTLAGLFFTPKEIALMLDIDTTALLKALKVEDSGEYRAFWGGRLQREMEYRNKVIGLANLGSSPAQTLVAKMIESSQSKMNNR